MRPQISLSGHHADGRADAVLRRQPPMRRFLLRLFSPIPFTWLDIRIPAWMLEPSLETVLEQTEHYAHESIKRRLEEESFAASDGLSARRELKHEARYAPAKPTMRSVR